MKPLLQPRLWAAMLLCLLMTQAAQALTFTNTSNGVTVTYYISYTTDTECSVYGTYSNGYHPAIDNLTTGAITIPNSVTYGGKTYKVTKIGSYAFAECRNITSVTLPTSVTYIDYQAFYNCTLLSTIKGLDNVTYISSSSFEGTPWLSNLPDGLNYIGKVLYNYKGTMPANTTINVKEGTTQIVAGAFSSQDGLVGVTIPKSTTNIAYSSFTNCGNLRSIVISSDNTVYDSRSNCNAIIHTSNNQMQQACAGTTIPSTVKSIFDWRNGGYSLYSLNLGNYLTSIDTYSFSLSRLRNVTIGSAVTSIGNGAFDHCSNLQVVRSLITTPFEIANGVFHSNTYETGTLLVPTGTKSKYAATAGWKNFKNIVEYSGSGYYEGQVLTSTSNGLTLVYQVTSLANNTCELIDISGQYDALTGQAVIPSTVSGFKVTNIAGSAFLGCVGLTGVTIGSNVTNIGNYAFYNCESLSSLSLPVTLKTIGNYILASSGIKQLTIPRIVESIGYGICYGCDALESISVATANTHYDARGGCNAIIETATNKLIASCKNTVIPETTVEIGRNAFSLSKAETIVIPNSVKTIAPFAFSSCAMSHITIPASVDSIGTNAFNACQNLDSIVVLIANPFALPQAAFNANHYEQATLYVPEASLQKYYTTDGWNLFWNIEPMSTGRRGDVNGDNKVNGTDLVALTRIILKQDNEVPAADVNNDNTVNGVDFVALVNLVLDEQYARTADAGSNMAQLAMEPFSILPGETRELFISLSNPGQDITLVQADLQLPQGLTLAAQGADMTGRTTWRRHQLSTAPIEGGLRMMLSSGTNATIDGSEGALISLPLTATADFAGGTIMLREALSVSPQQKAFWSQEQQLQLQGTATGISNIARKGGADSKIYSVSGQRLTAPQKGLNIVDGKKVVVK